MVMSDSGNEYHTVLNESIFMCDQNSMTWYINLHQKMQYFLNQKKLPELAGW